MRRPRLPGPHTTHVYMQPATLAARVIASSPRRHRRQNGAGPDRGRYSEEGGPDFLRRPARATLTALSSTGQSPVHCPLLRCHREGRPNLLLHGAVRARPRTPRARRPPLLFSRCSRASRTRATPLRGWAGTSRSEAALVGAQDGGRRALRQDCRDRCRPPLPPAPPLPPSLAQPTRRRRPAAAAVARERRGECVWAAARQGTSPSRTRSR